MRKIYAFIMGIVESRSDFTMNFEDGNGDDPRGLQHTYEFARSTARKLQGI